MDKVNYRADIQWPEKAGEKEKEKNKEPLHISMYMSFEV